MFSGLFVRQTTLKLFKLDLIQRANVQGTRAGFDADPEIIIIFILFFLDGFFVSLFLTKEKVLHCVYFDSYIHADTTFYATFCAALVKIC